MNTVLEKAMKGDKDAFIEVINSIERKLYIIAKSKLNNEEDVKDVIQETILLSYKNIRKLKDSTKFDAWIITILINNCNLLYKSKKNVIHIPCDEKNLPELSDENNCLNLEQNLDFFQLLNLLDENEKIIFSLFYVDNYTTDKISKILDINENTVKSKLKRAREKIKNYIERRDNSEK